MAELTVNVPAGDDDAHDGFPNAFRAWLSAGDDDASDEFPTGGEGTTPYAFVM